MLFNDPEAPTTIDERFDYGPLTGGDVTGSAVIDPGSICRSRPTRADRRAGVRRETMMRHWFLRPLRPSSGAHRTS